MMMWALPLVLGIVAGPARAEWQMTHGMTSAELGDQLEAAKARNLGPLEIESIAHEGSVLYSVVWVEAEGAAWRLQTGMNSVELAEWSRKLEKVGLAPTSLAIESVGADVSYAAVWHESGGDQWQLRLDERPAELQSQSDGLVADGYVPIGISGYVLAGEVRFATIWHRGTDVGAWRLRTNLDAASLQATYDELTPQGYVPGDISSYEFNGDTRFAGIWIHRPDVRWEARSGLSAAQFTSFTKAPEFADLDPHLIAAYNVGGTIRYLGAWHREQEDFDPPASLGDSSGTGHDGNAIPPARTKILPIAPVMQHTPVWCWVAVGEMLFRYFGLPNMNPGGNYQCGIIGLVSSPDSACYRDCLQCIVPSGSNQGTLRMLTIYTGRTVGRPARYTESERVPADVFVSEIDAGRPVLVGMSTNRRTFGEAEHVALVVGYLLRNGTVDLVVNDTFGYPVDDNPYLRYGGEMLASNQYRIAYRAFRDGVFWHWTVHHLAL